MTKIKSVNENKFPKGTIVWVKAVVRNGDVYYITSDSLRTKYTLWKQEGVNVKKVKSGKTPKAFEKELEI